MHFSKLIIGAFLVAATGTLAEKLQPAHVKHIVVRRNLKVQPTGHGKSVAQEFYCLCKRGEEVTENNFATELACNAYKEACHDCAYVDNGSDGINRCVSAGENLDENTFSDVCKELGASRGQAKVNT
ncbi:hypothetical protein HYALB_00002338 [Hymenoscyphus albidus]|uniref:Uncharacterized protein n=1 Tax=Hymenoscyphus albidus TaxID=595503 RepID=A0A9N9M0Q6_9HELO|nr:hypothetical protein HYALB_00002338 [Hymenoscyphus albidus]